MRERERERERESGGQEEEREACVRMMVNALWKKDDGGGGEGGGREEGRGKMHNVLQSILTRRTSLTRRKDGQSIGARWLQRRSGVAAIIGDNVVGEVFSTGTINFLNLYNTVLVVRLVSTWFPNIPQSVVQPLR